MTKLNQVVYLSLLALLSSYGNAVAADAAKGKEAFEICAVCHGADGSGNYVIRSPRIAGQEDWYVERQLKNFRDGLRAADDDNPYGVMMRGVAKTLEGDQVLADLAAYVTSLEAPAPETTVTGNVENGEKLYAPCVACHGKNGEGNKSLNAPRLAGNHDWYLVQQLQNYNSGVRGSDPKNVYDTQMKPMASTLTSDQAIKDVVAYINTL